VGTTYQYFGSVAQSIAKNHSRKTMGTALSEKPVWGKAILFPHPGGK
jgi:hypothetical protein